MSNSSIFEKILECVGVGIFVLVDDKILYTNDKARKLMEDFNDAELTEKIKIKQVNSEKEKHELRLKDVSGNERYLFLEISKFTNPVIAVVVDMTTQKESSYIDTLTRVGNRRKYEQVILDDKFVNMIPMTTIMCDINGLKLANDLFGHEVGDEVIKVVARILKKSIRSSDILCRIGGDEFVILLPNADNRAAETVCQRIMGAVIEYGDLLIPPSFTIDYAVRSDLCEDIPSLRGILIQIIKIK